MAALPWRTGTAPARVEEQIKSDLKVTIRCIPLDDQRESARAGNLHFQRRTEPRSRGLGEVVLMRFDPRRG